VVEQEDALVIEFAEPVGLDAEILPDVQQAAHTLCHPVQPRPAAGIGPANGHEIDLGVRPLGKAAGRLGSLLGIR
jgi:hypothetical protein